MSYNCGKHGWQHSYKPCPACVPEITLTAGTQLSKPITTNFIASSLYCACGKEQELIDLKAKYEKVIDALKKYKSISVCLEDGDTFVADETLKEIGEE